MTTSCTTCNRTFATVQALQQHVRDSPVHAVTFDCDECGRVFNTVQALQQHLRDSPVHAARLPSANKNRPFNIHPSLHQDVLWLLRPYGLSFDFFGIDNPKGALKEKDTSIMGTFTCTSSSCRSRKWTSKKIAITIRRYPGNRYNARVYSQRCESCGSLCQPVLDSSYAERVSYRLAKWSGMEVDEPRYSGSSQRPHQISLCEGCKHGRCQQS